MFPLCLDEIRRTLGELPEQQILFALRSSISERLVHLVNVNWGGEGPRGAVHGGFLLLLHGGFYSFLIFFSQFQWPSAGVFWCGFSYALARLVNDLDFRLSGHGEHRQQNR